MSTTSPSASLVGRVPTSSVLQRFGRLIAPDVCDCPECTAAGVEGPPCIVPAGYDVVDGQHVRMGLWIHGWKLREHELARAGLNDALRRVMDRFPSTRPDAHA